MDDMCAVARYGKHVWGRGRAVPVSAWTAARETDDSFEAAGS